MSRQQRIGAFACSLTVAALCSACGSDVMSVGGTWAMMRTATAGPASNRVFSEKLSFVQRDAALTVTVDDCVRGTGQALGATVQFSTLLPATAGAGLTTTFDGHLEGGALVGSWSDNAGSSGTYIAKSSASTPPTNSELRIQCSVVQAYRFQQDRQLDVGFLESISVAGQRLSADQTVRDPENPTQDKKVVGVLSDISWPGGYADPIRLSAQVSALSRQSLANAAMGTLGQVTLQFTAYRYDPKERKYHKGFSSCGAELAGSVANSGGQPLFEISEDPSTEILSPENYRFDLGVAPSASNMSLCVATCAADSCKYQMRFGVAASQ